MNSLLRNTLTTVFPILVGMLTTAHFYPYLFNEQILKNSKAQKSAERVDKNVDGLFGYNLTKDFDVGSCSFQPLNLNGVIINDQQYLFNIVGSGQQRIYKPNELIDGKYPVIAYSTNRALLLVSGKPLLLCNTPPVKSEPIKAVKLQVSPDIKTPYFILNAKKDPNNNTIGYTFKQCTYRCKMTLKLAGLQETDIITSINDVPFTNPEVLQNLKSKIHTLNNIHLSVFRGGQLVMITLKNVDTLYDFLPSHD